MIPTVIYLIEAIRRGLFIVAQSYGEAMDQWRHAARKYPFAE